jgi:hypothetical protein
MTRHPSEAELALQVGGELDWTARLRVAWHVRSCEGCTAKMRGLAESRRALAERSAEFPPEFDWESLAGEMRANIRLGLAAGAAVGGAAGRPLPALVPEAAGWRLAVVLGSMAFVAAAGWLLQAPRPERPAMTAAIESPASAEILLDAQPAGLAVRERGAELTLLGPGSQPLTTAVSWDGGARARFMDAETAQVTIYNVAAQ